MTRLCKLKHGIALAGNDGMFFAVIAICILLYQRKDRAAEWLNLLLARWSRAFRRESDRESGGPEVKPILIVDDDPGLQEMLQATLEYEGYTVFIAEDGQKALAVAEQEHPGLVLLDLMMPRMDGRAFMAELERRGLRGEMAVLVVSADRHAKEIAEGLNVDGLILKPFDVPEFMAAVHQMAR
jgi:CheY-like chemotaxis protein